MFASTATAPEETRTLALDRHAPEWLQDATKFKTHAHIFNPVWVIGTLRRYEGPPHRLLDPLYQAVEEAAKEAGSGFGRPRGAGRFELAYLAFVFSRHPDVRPWWQTAGRSIWRSSGFKERPSYALCQRRFAELEHPAVIAAMEQVASTLIQLAVVGSGGRVGRFLHVDSTEAETHARLEHICPPSSPCHARKAAQFNGGRGRRVSAGPMTPMVRAERHLDAETPEPEPSDMRPDTEIGDADRIDRSDGKLRVRVGGCWYAVLDATAGVRAFPRAEAGQTMQQFADSIGQTGTQVALATSVFTPGHNRLAFGVLDDQNRFVYAPTAVYVARSARSTEIVGPYTAPADLLVTEPRYRSKQAATEEDPFAAIYQADAVDMERPGEHVVLVVSRVDGRPVAAPQRIQVRSDSPVPDIGERAPKVQTDTVSSAGRVEFIDTREPPAPELHERSFDQVVGKKPVALLFATPQLCQSRVCGPVVDIALQLRERYGDQVQFIHQEVYVDNDPSKGLRPPLERFALPSEPWLFAIDTDGRVAARLEGSFGLDAFDRAIKAAIARSN